jgi:hypothetical protein
MENHKRITVAKYRLNAEEKLEPMLWGYMYEITWFRTTGGCFRGRREVRVKYLSVAQTRFTDKQGQYLAFIFYYTKIHGCAPAEADLQKYFRVSPPSVHQMILALEKGGHIERLPRQKRSIRLLVDRKDLPELE